MLTQTRQLIANFVYPEGVRERRSFERQLNVDSLTKLGNRRAFDLARSAAEDDSDLCIVVFDLNNLGKFNKEIGHEAGDRMIVRAGEAIAHYFPRAFRFGGDEFVGIINVSEVYFAVAMAEDKFGQEIGWSCAVSLTGSIGSTFEAADKGLQELKRKRKQENNYVV